MTRGREGNGYEAGAEVTEYKGKGARRCRAASRRKDGENASGRREEKRIKKKDRRRENPRTLFDLAIWLYRDLQLIEKKIADSASLQTIEKRLRMDKIGVRRYIIDSSRLTGGAVRLIYKPRPVMYYWSKKGLMMHRIIEECKVRIAIS